MNKNEIKKKYFKKIKLLKKYNQSYFNNNKSLIPDYKYDEIKNEFI